MISHVVLIKPRPDLTSEESRAFVAAFERAIMEIPTICSVRIGHRIRHGAAYESLGPDVADYVVIIDFKDLEGLQAYLDHPAHAELAARFYSCMSAAMVYDYRIAGFELLNSESCSTSGSAE